MPEPRWIRARVVSRALAAWIGESECGGRRRTEGLNKPVASATPSGLTSQEFRKFLPEASKSEHRGCEVRRRRKANYSLPVAS
jgi:hypothetical protein